MENKIRSNNRKLDDRKENKRYELKIFLFFVFLLSFFVLNVPFCIFAQEKKAEKEPVVITSEVLTADNKAKTALFERSVVAKKGDMTLFADRMLVYYSENKDGSSSIKRIDAEGSVKLIKGDRIVISKAATYFAEPEERIIFTGEPRATEGENVVIGSKMTYFLKDDRSIVENSKVMLIDQKGGNIK
jgi:lipopolysaccharide export system protein LptA